MHPNLTSIIGKVPHRLALAGGWIDQPFVSEFNPSPPGSMVVVSLEPILWLMERAGMAGGTRRVALRLWNGALPDRPKEDLVRELYREENKNLAEPSGSQDMIGLIYPGISRLDYDVAVEGGYFPAHIESCGDPDVARWLETILHLVPLNQRPEGYAPLEVKNLDPEWIRRLGQSGRDCYDAILAKDIGRLAASMNEGMACWKVILPRTVCAPRIMIDLEGLLHYHQRRYAGAMFSGCGGGYLIVASEEPVPGSMQVKIRLS